MGLLVGAYQLCRTLTNLLSLKYPRISHSVGTLIAFCGYLSGIFININDRKKFAIGVILIGFCETLSSMQVYVKELYVAEPAVLGSKLKMQYIFIILGVTSGFISGGFVFENYGFKGASVLGSFFLGFELVSIFIAFYIQNAIKN